MIRNTLFVALTLAGVGLIVASTWLVWMPAGMFVSGFAALILARSVAEVPDAD